MAVFSLGSGSPSEMFSRIQGPTLVLANGVRLNAVHAINEGDTTAYLQLFDAAAASDVTLGKTVPKDTVVIPAAQDSPKDLLAGSVQANFGFNAGSYPLGLVIAATQSRGGKDLVYAGDVHANIARTRVG